MNASEVAGNFMTRLAQSYLKLFLFLIGATAVVLGWICHSEVDKELGRNGSVANDWILMGAIASSVFYFGLVFLENFYHQKKKNASNLSQLKFAKISVFAGMIFLFGFAAMLGSSVALGIMTTHECHGSAAGAESGTTAAPTLSPTVGINSNVGSESWNLLVAFWVAHMTSLFISFNVVVYITVQVQFDEYVDKERRRAQLQYKNEGGGGGGELVQDGAPSISDFKTLHRAISKNMA